MSPLVTFETSSCLSGSKTLITITTPAPWSKIALIACGMVYPAFDSPKYLTASISFNIRTGSFIVLYSSDTSSTGAVPTNPITAVFTVFIVLAPFSISIVSTPCKKFAGLYNSSLSSILGIVRVNLNSYCQIPLVSEIKFSFTGFNLVHPGI